MFNIVVRYVSDALYCKSDAANLSRQRPGRNTLKRPIRIFCDHHNRIQFFGYEAANILLVWDRTDFTGTALSSFNREALAALAFLVGSAWIFAYHPDRRPYGLFYGSLGLILGGILLVAAGYSLTGLSVVLASMEAARGGLSTLQANLARPDHSKDAAARLTLVCGLRIFAFYIIPVNVLCQRFGSLGRFLNNRPFLTGTLIKLPMRLEFIVRNVIRGDVVGVVVGLSWMILGDGALAFNDRKLYRSMCAWSGASMTHRPPREIMQGNN